MEKKVYELKVDEEFSTMFPPLEEDEYRGLEESLMQDGCTDPLIVWHGAIIDGNNRFKICTEHGIPFLYEEKDDLPDRGAVKVWMAKRQLARRNLNAYQKSRMALMLEPKLREEARERQGNRNDLLNIPKNSSESSGSSSEDAKRKERGSRLPAAKDRETRERLADIAGVSSNTINKVKKIEAAADDETKQKLENGEISIHKAYTDLVRTQPAASEDHTPANKGHAPKKENQAPAYAVVEGGKGMHIEGKMPDQTESFPIVKELLEDVARTYLVSLEHILKQYTPGMVTEENNEEIRSMFRGTNKEALGIIRKRIEEVSDPEQ